MNLKDVGIRILFAIYRIIVNIIGLGIAAAIFKHVSLSSATVLIVAAIILTILNLLVKPLLLLISLPLIFLTMGIAYFIINAIIIMIVSWAVKGYDVDGLWSAVGVSLVVSIINVIFDVFTKSKLEKNDNKNQIK